MDRVVFWFFKVKYSRNKESIICGNFIIFIKRYVKWEFKVVCRFIIMNDIDKNYIFIIRK